MWSAFCAKYSSNRNSMLVSRMGRAWRVTQCEDVSMSMSVKRYFIGNGEFWEAKVVYFFGMHKFYANFLAYVKKKQYLRTSALAL